MFVSLLSSCSETNNESTEFADWENRNNTYFANIYNQAKAAISSGDTTWKLIRSYSKNPATTEPTDFIVVKVLHDAGDADGKGTPIYTDSVSVHYRGYLMPSDSYNTEVEDYPNNVGYQFDSSWTGKYNLATMNPTKSVASGYIEGFTNALTSMHIGDRWLVYIPQKQGYGAKAETSIPAYSTLIFEMTLSSFWKARIN